MTHRSKRPGCVRLSILVMLAFVLNTGLGLATTYEVPKRTLYFELGRVELSSSSLALLEEAAAERGQHWLVVVGHTDRVGSAGENSRLSQRRAESVMAALVALGVPETRMIPDWLGEGCPAVRTEDEVGEPQNRRVDIWISYSNGAATCRP